MVRPSASSTHKVSLVTLTLVATTDPVSTAEEVIPSLQQVPLVIFDQVLNSIDVFAAETVTTFQPNRIEPELGFAIVALDVHVRWFVSVARVKEESEWSAPQHRRHHVMVPPGGAGDKSPSQGKKKVTAAKFGKAGRFRCKS
jgi:hypothetical protein